MNAKSVIGIHRVLRKALNQAYKLQMITKNPADCTELPKPKRYYPKLLADEDIERFIKAFFETDIYIPTMLSLMLGLRRGETLGLRWQDINWINNIICIRQSVLPTKNGIIFADVKTESSHRDIPVSEHIINMLKEYKTIQDEYKKYFDKAYIDNDLICCKKDGFPYNPGTFSHMFENILIKNNIPQMRFHDLRHTNATLMLKNNISAKIASSRLGHATTAITLDLYSHVLPDMHKEAIEKLDNVFFK